MEYKSQYGEYRKPRWAPPAWLFGPVWGVLYVLIAVSFGFVFVQYSHNAIPLLVALPFLLNILCNVAFTPIQFGLRNFTLALVDILLVFGTLVWALVAIYPYAPWVMYINIPYLAWVAFATVLQTAVVLLNSKK
jgi:translocator protein